MFERKIEFDSYTAAVDIDLENDLNKCTINCQAIKHKSIYVTAHGHVFPCCWLGTNVGQGHDSFEIKQVQSFIQDHGYNKINLYKKLKEIKNAKNNTTGI